MSADNGIYILQTKGAFGFEFRVAHCMAIDNIHDEKLGDAYTVLNFGDSPVTTQESEASELAKKLLEEWSSGTVEYGIVWITEFKDQFFPQMTKDEAREKVEDVFFARPKGSEPEAPKAQAGFSEFWMVFAEGGGNSTVKHPTEESANKEAERLVLKNKRPAYVLKTVNGFRPVDQVIRMVPTR